MLRLDDRWVWDWWLADTGSEYHLFFLQAPRSLGRQILRHRSATVGHAVSTDLREWQMLPTALEPGPRGSWDDVATWTGSTLWHDGLWHTFYTGVSSVDKGLVQRIGRATSTDLMVWQKDARNPLIEADHCWYEVLDLDAWHDQAWRDPWVFSDPEGDGFHALITARAAAGAAGARGVIGHAWSPDLEAWEVRPPLTEPGEFGQLEVPQVEIVDGTPVLLFSCARAHIASARQARLPGEQTGAFITTGGSLLGPFDIAASRRIPVPDLYSARIVRDRSGAWQVLGFIDGSERDEFVGVLSDPIPLGELDVLPGLGATRFGPR